MKKIALSSLALVACATMLAACTTQAPTETASNEPASPETSQGFELPATAPPYGVEASSVGELREVVEAAGVQCDSFSPREVTIEGAIDAADCNSETVLVIFEDRFIAHGWSLDRVETDGATLLGDDWAIGTESEVADMLEKKIGGVSSSDLVS